MAEAGAQADCNVTSNEYQVGYTAARCLLRFIRPKSRVFLDQPTAMAMRRRARRDGAGWAVGVALRRPGAADAGEGESSPGHSSTGALP
uniref:Uncharacterized protein n=1 Tax=Oryza sativa subsp. japonica TaxID=39947 RepID=Q8H3E8_ORYSJ|nr:hypothetical protein [Oryza sativa Japonica Group]BAD32045.1 hypothetical protein [Oryza sativa Japonica Group]